MYFSSTFASTDDFSNYPEILDVPGEAASPLNLYNLPEIRSGRYIVVHRQNLLGYLDIWEIDVLAIV